MQYFILLILGFAVLVVGGEFLVKGAVGIARNLEISPLVIGMTVVSFATSAPELFVSLQAVLNGSNDIAFGNVIGSNIANITLVLGVTALIFRVKISDQTATLNYPVLLLASLIFGAVMFYFNGIPQEVGFLFIILLLLFSWLLISNSRKENLKSPPDEDEFLEEASQDSLFKSLVFLIAGILVLKFGADYLVDGTIAIAKKFEISERVIAVTVVAIGTSIPELATSIVAALKKEHNLAVGNLIGSNIFNILFILGISSLIKPLPFQIISNLDILVMTGATLLVVLSVAIGRKNNINRISGGVFILGYICYIIFLIFRG